jgi:hypothetical protein
MTGRKTNVGRRDRIARGILAPILLLGALWLYYSVPRGPLTVAAMGGLGLLVFVLATGAITGTCGVYAMLGIDTCSCEVEYSGGDTWG